MATPLSFNVYAPGSRGPLEVLDGSDWRMVPKVRNVGFSATSPSETTTEYVSEVTETRTGQAGPGNVTYDVTRAPSMRAYRLLRAAFEEGNEVTLRDWGGIPEVFDNPATATADTIAIATTGVVTLSGSLNAGTAREPSNRFQPGPNLGHWERCVQHRIRDQLHDRRCYAPGRS